MTTIREIFGLSQVVPYKYNKQSTGGPDNDVLYGVELEIEYADFDWEGHGFSAKEDGSLRHRGVEFVSSPMNYDTIVTRLNKFFGNARSNGFNPDQFDHYSERTSVHVHTNCQDLTIPQVTSILLLYQATEKLLFDWIGHDRDKNIFCVPWCETLIKFSALDNLSYYVSMSSVERNKYTALNIVPLKELGTIEWRHMAGECDLKRLVQWLRFIGHYFRVARTVDYQEIYNRVVNLNTSSQYDHLLDWLFQGDVSQLRTNGYKHKLEDGVLSVKYSLLKPKPVKKLNINIQRNSEIERINEILNQQMYISSGQLRAGDIVRIDNSNAVAYTYMDEERTSF